MIAVSITEFDSVYAVPSSIALTVERFTDQHKSFDINMLYNKMGFKTEEEYFEMYPGKFRLGSNTTSIYLNKAHVSHDCGEKFYCTNISTYHPAFQSSVPVHIKAYINNNRDFFIVPTVEDSLKTGIEIENLWFCSNWSEEK